MKEPSFIENVNKLAKNINAIVEASNLFDVELVDRLEGLAKIDLKEITDDLKKGNYLGNRKIDIDLALNNNNSKQEEVTYKGATIVTNAGVVLNIPFEAITSMGDKVVEEIASYTALYNKLNEGIDNYNSQTANKQLHITNYEIDVINQTIIELPTMLRIRDTDGNACNIDRITLHVYRGSAKEINPAYFWTKTTSALEVLANRIPDIIKLGVDIDKIIALADKEDEIQHLYDVREILQTLADNIINIIKAVKNETNINKAVANETNINKAVANEININKVANIDEEIKATANIDEEIKHVENEIEDIKNVEKNLLNVNAVSKIVSEIEEIAGIKIPLINLNTNLGNLNTINNNLNMLDDVHDNLDSINLSVSASKDLINYKKELEGYKNKIENFAKQRANLKVNIVTLTSNESAYANYDNNTYILTIGIPKGLKGDKGDPFKVDAGDTIAKRINFDGASKGFAFLSLDENPTKIYFKKSDKVGDWSVGVPFGKGKKGDKGDIGVSIVDIKRTAGTGKAGTIDTYTISLSNGLSKIFTVKNGETQLVKSVNKKTGEIVLTKDDIGLKNVDNTNDLSKPISRDTQTALNKKANTNETYNKSEVDTKLNTKAGIKHNHDSSYYTKNEINTKLNKKANNFIVETTLKDGSNNPIASNVVRDVIISIQNKIKSDDAKFDTIQEIVNALKQNITNIKNIRTLLSSSDTSLDTIQEIVNYIKTNKNLLTKLSLDNIFETSTKKHFTITEKSKLEKLYTKEQLDTKFNNYLPKNAKAVDSDKLDGFNSTDFLKTNTTPADIGAWGGELVKKWYRGDLNNLTKSGSWHPYIRECTNTPVHTDNGLIHISEYDYRYTIQDFTDWAGKKFIRVKKNKNWQDWIQVYTTKHKPTPQDIGAYSKTEADAIFFKRNTSFKTDKDVFLEFPNTTWNSSLRIGGNGYTANAQNIASVTTTNGNLHLDSGTKGRAIYLQYSTGGKVTIGKNLSNQVIFENGTINAHSYKIKGQNLDNRYLQKGEEGMKIKQTCAVAGGYYNVDNKIILPFSIKDISKVFVTVTPTFADSQTVSGFVGKFNQVFRAKKDYTLSFKDAKTINIYGMMSITVTEYE